MLAEVWLEAPRRLRFAAFVFFTFVGHLGTMAYSSRPLSDYPGADFVWAATVAYLGGFVALTMAMTIAMMFFMEVMCLTLRRDF